MPSHSPTSQVAVRDLSFSYAASVEPLLVGLDVAFPSGFTAIIGANGCGKTSLLKLLAGELLPDSGTIEGNAFAVYCEQRTDTEPEQLSSLLDDWSPSAFELRGRLDVPDDASQRWDSLSHGERKRVQIACALWQEPTLLLIDEPTNHIDNTGRELLEGALRRFRGVGVIVSHDRELLDSLCVQSVWLQPPTGLVYQGGYEKARSQREQNQLSANRTRERLRTEQRRIDREVVRRRERASRADAERSKRGIAPKDNDARGKINRARVTGKDAVAGKLLRQLDGRADQAAKALAETRASKEYQSGIWLQGEASKADSLFVLPQHELPLGATRTLVVPKLLMRPKDRIAVSGANGAGKSTLIRSILAKLAMPSERLLLMPQEVTAKRSTELLQQVKSLPREELGRVMSIVRRLGSRPSQLLDSQTPSPGEVRKLLLALGIVQSPHLLILDEPTNHLDVLAIESLEEALAECPCGLLVVSHDRRLIKNLQMTEWRIEQDAQGNSLLRMIDE